MNSKISIERFDSLKHAKMLKDFNNRISSTGLVFDSSVHPLLRYPSIINQEQFILVENEETIRCVTKIKNQPYFCNGNRINFQDIQIPISESIVNKRFLASNLFFLKSITKRSENMHALGMGGIDQPLPRILNKLGFDLIVIDFLFFPLKVTSLINIGLRRVGFLKMKFLSVYFSIEIFDKCFN